VLLAGGDYGVFSAMRVSSYSLVSMVSESMVNLIGSLLLALPLTRRLVPSCWRYQEKFGLGIGGFHSTVIRIVLFIWRLCTLGVSDSSNIPDQGPYPVAWLNSASNQCELFGGWI